MQGIETFVSVS